MQDVESKRPRAVSRPEDRQGKQGASVDSPRRERFTRLATLTGNGALIRRQRRPAAMVDVSPRMAAQRRAAGMIHDSPRQAAQRKVVEGIHESPALALQRHALGPALGGVTPRKAAQSSSQTQAPRSEEDSARRNTTGMPDRLKAGIESLSGTSLDAVRVHYNSAVPAQLHAFACAQGTDIHLGPGQEKHLPHEAWHVVQQAQGRVRPTMHMKEGTPVNDDAGLEREADAMGDRAMAAKPVLRKAGPDPLALRNAMTSRGTASQRRSARDSTAITPSKPVRAVLQRAPIQVFLKHLGGKTIVLQIEPEITGAELWEACRKFMPEIGARLTAERFSMRAGGKMIADNDEQITLTSESNITFSVKASNEAIMKEKEQEEPFSTWSPEMMDCLKSQITLMNGPSGDRNKVLEQQHYDAILQALDVGGALTLTFVDPQFEMYPHLRVHEVISEDWQVKWTVNTKNKNVVTAQSGKVTINYLCIFASKKELELLESKYGARMFEPYRSHYVPKNLVKKET